MTQDVLQDEFIKLREEAIWLRQIVNSFNHLFDSGPDTDQVLKESACLFFGDLNRMMHEYTFLLVCHYPRGTGPPIHIPFFLEAAILSRIRGATSRRANSDRSFCS